MFIALQTHYQLCRVSCVCEQLMKTVWTAWIMSGGRTSLSSPTRPVGESESYTASTASSSSCLPLEQTSPSAFTQSDLAQTKLPFSTGTLFIMLYTGQELQDTLGF